MQKLNLVRKSPQAKSGAAKRKQAWEERRKMRREEEKKQSNRKAIQLPTSEIANWTPEQWQEFEKRIGIKPRS